MTKITNTNKTYFEKLKSIPGISHAFMSLFRTANWAEEVNKWDEKQVKEFLYKGISKIVDLWSLSHEAERAMVKNWIEKEKEEPKVWKIDKDELTKLISFYNKSGEKLNNEIISHKNYEEPKPLYEFNPKYLDLETEIIMSKQTIKKLNMDMLNIKLKEKEIKITELDQLRDEHLYLDVTTMDYKTFIKAFKAIRSCRKELRINKTDMKKGAPESIDSTRAILLARAKSRGLTRKELADILDFKVYKQDNPSGSHPLLYKYLKIGRNLILKLNSLDKYLLEIANLPYDEEYFK